MLSYVYLAVEMIVNRNYIKNFIRLFESKKFSLQYSFLSHLEKLRFCQLQVIKSRVASKEKWSISFSEKENVPNFLCLVTCCPLVHPAKPTSQAQRTGEEAY